ncbi:MAG: class I adenylate-forming enzyme family protein [Aeromicrobium sp.]|uniref:class I adenylate-forming enzyme family protein n=1 Tax=Aeromicrobium sp. TaxID=1871063 RepID=UPI002639B49D|nr:class I adenylate-forming enzyme family protein [Aeromicrobium sp.]MDF1705941.1 class I adenylate-forming enzyme family protein [Aeromicrobium sp.]
MTSAHDDIVPDLTFREFWERQVDATPDREFLIYGDQRFTYTEVDQAANRVAAGLQAQGIGAGDRIALLLPSDRELLDIELAIHKVGAVMVPMIYGLTAPEVAYVVGHAEPTMCITDAASFEALAVAGEVPGAGRTTWLAFGAQELDPTGTRVQPAEALYTDIATRPALSEIGPRDPMAIMYTSGSTGKPKGVLQPSRGLVSAGVLIADRLGMGVDDTVFCCLPLFHAAGTHMLFAPAVACGGRFALVPSFSRDLFWDQVRSSGSTMSLLMPAQLAILMTLEPSDRDRDHGLTRMFSHIQPHDFIERFGTVVCTAWAMTETSGIGIMSHPGDILPPACIGMPMATTRAKIIDATSGEPLPNGEQGELVFRHPDVMLEYINDTVNTADTLSDRWVHTGDLCSMDEGGLVYFHGRIKNIIKRAGENIAGEEVEFCLIEHPDVVDCVTGSVPDPIYTEEVHAIVGIRPGAQVTSQDITEWAAARLSDWKVPRYITVLEGEFPRLTNGKINRLQVRAENDVSTAIDGGSRSKSRNRAAASVTTEEKY